MTAGNSTSALRSGANTAAPLSRTALRAARRIFATISARTVNGAVFDTVIFAEVALGVGVLLTLTAARGSAAFSTYYVCDSRREKQADALVKQVFAPIYDKLIADGKLKSWGWLEHIVGGEYRRLATMSGADMKTVLEARASVNQALMDNPLGDTFTDICGSHTDYMWEIKYSKP